MSAIHKVKSALSYNSQYIYIYAFSLKIAGALAIIRLVKTSGGHDAALVANF